MPLLFRIYRDEQQELWIVLMADQLYGEYLDKVRAVLDAIETAEESRLEKQPRRAVSRHRSRSMGRVLAAILNALCATATNQRGSTKRIRRGSRS